MQLHSMRDQITTSLRREAQRGGDLVEAELRDQRRTLTGDRDRRVTPGRDPALIERADLVQVSPGEGLGEHLGLGRISGRTRPPSSSQHGRCVEDLRRGHIQNLEATTDTFDEHRSRRRRQTGRVTDVFSEKLAAWRDYAETPWARIRYGVAGEVLRRQSELLGERIRILDVGGGDGRDALPLALAGHDVTILDPSAAWLDEASRRAATIGTKVTTIRGGLDDLPAGEWDLVLCHFVLRYRTGDDADVAALASLVRPGGRLSIMDVNPDGRVLRELLVGGPAAALAELQAERAMVETFQTDARKVTVDAVAREAVEAGTRPIGVYGNRIANDLLVDNTAKGDPAFFEDLLALELELCDREPFNRVGFAWQLIVER
ncbi:MAG: class I SAM-dependent methyltransferase [Nocardioidaceae bacterium]|nr:class I SAM-dependent methyltransferase [Nocardioidaceae bacterium]